MATRKWTAGDDIDLWGKATARRTSVQNLAVEFNRSVGSIRSRLEHLRDPTHAAYMRLHGQSSGAKRSAPDSSVSSSSLSYESSIAAKFTPPPLLFSHIPEKITIETAEPTGDAEPQIMERDLNAEQTHVANLVLNHSSNVLLTGAAGTGKSFILKYIISALRVQCSREAEVVVTAPTGIAASHISGCTLHSFAGIGLGKGSGAKLLAAVQANASAVNRWRGVRVLVIDEVSMLDSQLFTHLEVIARTVRGSNLPFGGIQLLLCGDFFQLPPVQLGKFGCRFMFECSAWDQCNISTIELQQVIRQSGDMRFVSLLQQVRLGICTPDCVSALASCSVDVKPMPVDGILPTQLYCTNRNVDEVSFIIRIETCKCNFCLLMTLLNA
jgi:ATP-dependent DNA helicase PIF1